MPVSPVPPTPRVVWAGGSILYAIWCKVLRSPVFLRVLAPQLRVVQVFGYGRPGGDPVPAHLARLEPATFGQPAQVGSTQTTPDGRLVEREELLALQPASGASSR